jgi:hypothetical protein
MGLWLVRRGRNVRDPVGKSFCRHKSRGLCSDFLRDTRKEIVNRELSFIDSLDGMRDHAIKGRRKAGKKNHSLKVRRNDKARAVKLGKTRHDGGDTFRELIVLDL